MTHINEVNQYLHDMINQATFKFYWVLLDNESGNQMQLLCMPSVEQYCFEATSADRRHMCCKIIGQPPWVGIHRISELAIQTFKKPQ